MKTFYIKTNRNLYIFEDSLTKKEINAIFGKKEVNYVFLPKDTLRLVKTMFLMLGIPFEGGVISELVN